MHDGGFPGAANHTLVVAPGAVRDYGRDRDGYDGPREPGLQRWLFSRRLYYVLGGLAAVLLIGLLVWWQSAGKYATVPPVRGLAANSARLEVRTEGLTVKMGKPQFSTRVAKGDVVSTSPATGSRVSKGGTVLLIVSKGPQMISVPQVTGSPLASAEAALRRAGLTPGKVTGQTSTTIQSGIVISTTPAATVTWPQGRPVSLVVSTGQPVPNFVGRWRRGSGGEAEPCLAEAVQELAAVRWAEVRVAAGGPEDQVVQGGRDAVHKLRRRRHGLVHVLVGHRQRRVRGVRLLAGEHLEQQDPGRVDVGPRVGDTAGYLFRRQVGGGADQHAGLGVTGAREHPGQAKVGDLDGVVRGEQDVLWLDVPVREPGGVRGAEAAQHALHDVQGLAGR